MAVNVDVSKSKKSDISRVVRLAGSTGERYVLADQNVLIMNLDDYEDMLFSSNERIQKELEEDMDEYGRTGGIDYMRYRRTRLRK